MTTVPFPLSGVAYKEVGLQKEVAEKNLRLPIRPRSFDQPE